MSKSGDECPSSVIRHYTWIEEQFAANENIDEICRIFEIEPSMLNQKDFFWYLSDIYTMGVQYGDRTNLCQMLIENKDNDILTQLQAVSDYGKSKGVKYE